MIILYHISQILQEGKSFLIKNKNNGQHRVLLGFGLAFLVIFAVWVGLVACQSSFIAGYDRVIYSAIRNSNQAEYRLASLWTQAGDTIVITVISIALVLILAIFKKYGYAIFTGLVMICANGCNSIIKHVVKRQRPRIAASLNATGFSFPSGHSVGSMSLAIVLITLICLLVKQKPAKTILIALCVCFTLSIGFTRMYLHVHWPSDVTGGWLEGLTFGLLGAWILLWSEERKAAKERLWQ